MRDDMKLVREFAANGSGAEPAFAALVRRHLSLIHSAAMRQVRDAHLAEEIAQAVFIILARKAGSLGPKTILSAWLYRTTGYAAADALKIQRRRRHREQEAHMQSILNEPSADIWAQLAPLLDQAMAELGETDRSALVLRFFENKSSREIAEALCLKEQAVQKRITRGVEKLRRSFAKRGVTQTAAAIGLALTVNAVQAAPLDLAGIIGATTVKGAAVAASVTVLVNGTIKTIAMTTLQKTLIAVALVAAIGTGIYEAGQASRLRAQVQTLREQQTPLANQLAKLQIENKGLSDQSAQPANSQALTKAQFTELLKLRRKIGVAQADSHELAELKSTLAGQVGKIPDSLTNAIALGLQMAEKGNIKNVHDKLARMTKALNLTDDQTRTIGDIMKKNIHRETEMAMESIIGGKSVEQQKAMAAERGNQDDEIKALLTPDQLAAYPGYQQAEKTTAADTSATSEAGQIAQSFNLSEVQREQVHAAFYQINLNGLASGLKDDGGNIAKNLSISLEQQKSQLEEKVKILGSILNPEQIGAYRAEKMQRINMLADSIKLLVPQKSGPTTK
jgi:RNA polymerase sigma factor (sigma-70 family)